MTTQNKTPIKVSLPGFEAVFGIIGLFTIYILRKGR